MKNIEKSLIFVGALALVAGAAAYRMATPTGWDWTRLPGASLLEGHAAIVPPVRDDTTELGTGEPLDNDGDTEIIVVSVPEEPTPVTSSDESLPSASAIAVVDEAPVVATPEPESRVVAVVSPAQELAGRIALLIASVQANLPSTPRLAKDVMAWAERANDPQLVQLADAFAQPYVPAEVAPAVEEQQGWFDRWIKIKKVTPVAQNSDAMAGRMDDLNALVDYYLAHYAQANGENF